MKKNLPFVDKKCHKTSTPAGLKFPVERCCNIGNLSVLAAV
jgi:hypothetical protein